MAFSDWDSTSTGGSSFGGDRRASSTFRQASGSLRQEWDTDQTSAYKVCVTLKKTVRADFAALTPTEQGQLFTAYYCRSHQLARAEVLIEIERLIDLTPRFSEIATTYLSADRPPLAVLVKSLVDSCRKQESPELTTNGRKHKDALRRIDVNLRH